MKKIFFLLVLVSIVFADWEFTMVAGSVCDSVVHQELIIGANSECGAGYDLGWDVIRPPFPPSGALAYFYIDDPANPDIEGLLQDYRSDDEIHLLWRIHYYTTLCGMIGDSCVLTWEPDSLPEGTFKIIASMEDTGWRAPTSIDWSSATNMSSVGEFGPFWISHMAYIAYTSPLSVEEVPKPEGFDLKAWPNPFNSAVRISIDAPLGVIHELPLRIEVFDVNGRIISVIPDPDQESREATENLDSRFHGNDKVVVWTPDEFLGSGIYLVRVTIGDESFTKRIVYLK